MSNYSLQQAQNDIANTRYLLAALQNVSTPSHSPTFTGTVTFPDGSTWGVSGLTLAGSIASPTFTGTVTLPDGSTWTSGGPSLHVPLALLQGGTGQAAASNSALLSALGAAPLASPTFTGTVTFPDGSTFNSSGLTIASLKSITYSTGAFTNITGDSGWSAISGYAALKWRILPDGNVQFAGATQHTSITASLAINSSNPIPAAVRPSTIKKLSSGNVPLSELNCELGTGGVLTALANGSAAGTKVIIDTVVNLT